MSDRLTRFFDVDPGRDMLFTLILLALTMILAVVLRRGPWSEPG